MAAFDYEAVNRRRRLENWIRSQSNDHERQKQLATFLCEITQLANDLLKLRNAFSLIHGQANIVPDMTPEAFAAKQAICEMEWRIRRHSIDTFGQDIFSPDESVLTLPTPEGSQLG